MLQNEHILANISFDTAENEPAKNLQNLANYFHNFANPKGTPPCRTVASGQRRKVAVPAGHGTGDEGHEKASVVSHV